MEVVVDKVGRCGHTQVPAKGLQQQKLHFNQIFLVENQVQAAHEAQGVQLLQFGNPVLLLLKFTWKKKIKTYDEVNEKHLVQVMLKTYLTVLSNKLHQLTDGLYIH